MNKFLIRALVFFALSWAGSAMAATPPGCSDLGVGYIRDGVTNCGWLAHVESNGGLDVNVLTGGGGGGGASVTQRSAVAAVTAGTGQPLYGDSANGAVLFEQCQPGTLLCVNPFGPTPIMGADGATIATVSNPFPIKGPSEGAIGSAPPPSGSNLGNNVGGVLTGQIGCGSSIFYDASTSGETQLVAASSGLAIYVCGYTVYSAGTVNINLASADTGGSCANPVKITPAYQTTAQGGVVDGSPIFRGLKTPISKALCLNTSAAIAVQAIIYYTQF